MALSSESSSHSLNAPPPTHGRLEHRIIHVDAAAGGALMGVSPHVRRAARREGEMSTNPVTRPVCEASRPRPEPDGTPSGKGPQRMINVSGAGESRRDGNGQR